VSETIGRLSINQHSDPDNLGDTDDIIVIEGFKVK